MTMKNALSPRNDRLWAVYIQPPAVEHLRTATESLAEYLVQLVGQAERDMQSVDKTLLLAVHHAVCEGLAEVRQWNS